MNLNKPVRLPKKRAAYPSKTTLNLAMKEPSQFRPQRLVPLLLVLLIAAGLFGKSAVADRLAKVSEAQARLSALEARVAELQTSTADYDQVAAEYGRYSVGWMTDEERSIVDRTELLDLIEAQLMPAGRVLRFTASANLLSVQLSGVTLDDTSRVVERLYQQENVSNVALYTATTEEQTGDNATVSLIITLRDAAAQAEGGAEE